MVVGGEIMETSKKMVLGAKRSFFRGKWGAEESFWWSTIGRIWTQAARQDVGCEPWTMADHVTGTGGNHEHHGIDPLFPPKGMACGCIVTCQYDGV